MAQKLSSQSAENLDLSLVRYSRVFEDHRILSEALQITADSDTVLSITSSGDNVLNLLLNRPKKIIAMDMSVAQNSILELKLAAISHLCYHDYLVLLGETDSTGKERFALYSKLNEHLPQYAQEYWQHHHNYIEEGLCTSSRLQKYISKMVWERLSSEDNENFDRLFAAQSLQEQKKVFKSSLVDKIEQTMRGLFNKENQKSGRSAVQLKYVDDTVQTVEDTMWERFCRMCQDVDISDNYYLSWVVRGRRGFNPEANPDFAPSLLREDGFLALKGLIDRVVVYTGSLETFLSQTDLPVINKANLSDIFEYMSVADADKVFSTLCSFVSQGGRVAYWNLFNHRVPSTPDFKLLTQLSEELYKKDRMFFYSEFCVLEKL